MRMTWALAGAIAVAGLWATVGTRPKMSTVHPEPPLPAVGAAHAPSTAADSDEPALHGEVLEVLPVSKYTYLRLHTADGDIWAAVPSASVALHSQQTIVQSTRMDDFKSPTLGRTFKVIYFGNLASAASAGATAPNLPAVSDDQPLPPGHPDVTGAAPELATGNSNLPSGHPNVGAAMQPGAPPSDLSELGQDSAAAEAALPAPPSKRASGKNAHLIAELVAQRSALAGQVVRVRGQVTRVTDVQDHAFFHIRDASVGPDGHASDLAVTSNGHPKRGDIATFEGTLGTDVDVGIGFKYPALLQNATISPE